MVDRSAFHSLSYGLYVVSAAHEGRKYGCIANTFQQVTSTPPQVSVALNKENATTEAIIASGRYTVSVLAQDASMDLIGVFGFRTSTEVDKFEGVSFAEDKAGVPYVKEQSVARFSMRLVETVDVGTHLMLIGEVEEAEVLSSDEPLTYAYYHAVKRGKTPKKASSYVPKEEAAASKDDLAQLQDSAQAGTADSPAQPTEPALDQAYETVEEALKEHRFAWQCEICGHIEYADELPEGYECPLCGQGPEMFVRIDA